MNFIIYKINYLTFIPQPYITFEVPNANIAIVIFQTNRNRGHYGFSALELEHKTKIVPLFYQYECYPPTLVIGFKFILLIKQKYKVLTNFVGRTNPRIVKYLNQIPVVEIIPNLHKIFQNLFVSVYHCLSRYVMKCHY